MIQAKELSFGNKVFNQNGEIITVQQLLHSTVVYDSQMKISKETANIRGSNVISYTSEVIEDIKEAEYQELQPIVLTPQILQKCGFRNFIREEWILSFGTEHLDFEFTDEGLRLRHPTPTRIPINFLHQLQNFIFALTAEELEVNMGSDFVPVPRNPLKIAN